MSNDDLWGVFLETGRIDAYMAYKRNHSDFNNTSHNDFELYDDYEYAYDFDMSPDSGINNKYNPQ